MWKAGEHRVHGNPLIMIHYYAFSINLKIQTFTLVLINIHTIRPILGTLPTVYFLNHISKFMDRHLRKGLSPFSLFFSLNLKKFSRETNNKI